MWLVILLALALASGAQAQELVACESVPVYDPCEIRIEIPEADAAQHPNPYLTVTIRAEFRSPKGGRTKVMPAFWNGGREFVLRFSPDFEGRWDYRLISNIPAFDKQTGSFQAAPAATPGFIEIFNKRYFKYPLTNSPHYWLGASVLDLAATPWEAFQAVADRRADQGFTHVRALVLGQGDTPRQVFASPDSPSIEHFRALDRRVSYLHSSGFVTDLVLSSSGGDLERMFPRLRDLDRYIRYVCARYAAYSVTWQALLEWESHPEGSKLAGQVGRALAKHDPYKHPRSTGAAVTSAPLFEEEQGWQDYITQNRVEASLAAIEYETHPAPFVNTGIGAGADPETARKQAWNAAVRGHYVSLAGESRDADSPVAEQVSHLQRFFAQSRYFDLQPHYRVVGGAALALQRVPRWAENPIGIEYVVYVEEPGLIELLMVKHEYKVSWYDPATGAWFDQKKKFKGDRYRSRTPDDQRDWVLYVRREGKKQGMNKSFFLESKAPRMRDMEHAPSELPFAIQLPEAAQVQAGREHEFNGTLLKNTIAAKRMLWLWTGEVAGAKRGPRVLGTSQSGRFLVPSELASGYPATLSVRLVGLDGAGRLFEAFRTYGLVAPE